MGLRRLQIKVKSQTYFRRNFFAAVVFLDS